jgi:hypothetical protein
MQKDKHILGQNTLTTHNSKLGTTSRFVESKKRKNKFVEALLTYPTLLSILLPNTLKLAFPLSGLSSFGNKSDKTMCSSPRHQSCCDDCDDETNPHISSLPFAFYRCHSDLQTPYGSGG